MYEVRGANSVASSLPVDDVNGTSNDVACCKSKKDVFLEEHIQSKAAGDEQQGSR